MSPGAKFYDWELKGVPLRMEIGPKDVEKGTVVIVPRVELSSEEAGKPGRKQKLFVSQADLATRVPELLHALQQQLRTNATARLEANSTRGVSDYSEFKKLIAEEAGFVYTGWCGGAECEAKVKEETKATIRCLPFAEFQSPKKPETCIVCGGASSAEAVWAKAY
jgi:prolyl-tRNA synthetase